MAQRYRKRAFPVSWDQMHRDARALAWRLAELGPWQSIVAVTRGGLVPAAIVARELDIRLGRHRLHLLIRPPGPALGARF